jgi:hypothetical protein
VIIRAYEELIVIKLCILRPVTCLSTLSVCSPAQNICSQACMSGKHSVVEKSVEEILIDLMVEKVMSAGEHASSKRGLQASPLIARRYGPSRTTTEKWSKHRDDLANAKLIPLILPDYIPPLTGTVSFDIVLRDFEYTLITTYLPKRICTVGLYLG